MELTNDPAIPLIGVHCIWFLYEIFHNKKKNKNENKTSFALLVIQNKVQVPQLSPFTILFLTSSTLSLQPHPNILFPPSPCKTTILSLQPPDSSLFPNTFQCSGLSTRSFLCCNTFSPFQACKLLFLVEDPAPCPQATSSLALGCYSLSLTIPRSATLHVCSYAHLVSTHQPGILQGQGTLGQWGLALSRCSRNICKR